MKYKCCRFLKNGINFTRTGVRFCNKLSAINEGAVVPYEKNFIKKFNDIKIKYVEDCKKGKYPSCCQNCMYLEEKEWDDDLKISEIELFHWNHCNCACIYCAIRDETKLKITEKKSKSQFVDLYPILKYLVKNNYFAKQVTVSFVGGEPTLLKEFCDILKLFMKQNYKMHILTNGILYEKLFAKFLRASSENAMTISIDCGTREMFKRIKGVDKFDEVIKNIKRYIKDSKENSKNLILKYILIEGLNDNEEEILKWIELCKSIGVKILHPTIEFCHSVNDCTKTGPSEHIIKMYNFMKDNIIKAGLVVNTYDFVEDIVKKGSYR